METVKGDFHVHTRYSLEPRMLHVFKTLPLYGPEKAIKQSIKRGMNVVTITEHDSIRGAEIGEKIARKKYKDIIFVKGEEISTKDGHLIALGIEECIKPRLSAEETIDLVRDQGGVSIAPHPFTYYGLRNLILKLDIDGVEVLNPWAAVLRANYTARKVFPELNVAEIGATDAHLLSIIGKVFTNVKIKQHSVDGVLEGIRKKRTTAESNMTPAGILLNLFEGIGLSFVSMGRKNV